MGDWLLGFEFYPADPENWVLAQTPGKGLTLLERPRKAWPGQPRAHPLELYLKAHGLNQRVSAWERLTDHVWAWTLEPSGTKVHWVLEGAKLKVTVVLGERADVKKRPKRDFEVELPLAKWVEVASPDPVEGASSPPEGEASPASTLGEVQRRSQEERKREKLLGNVRGDLERAESEAREWAELWEHLRLHPRAFESERGWPEGPLGVVVAAQSRGELPSWGAASVGPASRKVFDRKRRVERRVEGARKRLRELESGAAGRARPLVPGRKRLPEGPVASPEASTRPSRRPGVWVEILAGLWARVGRSAEENDELFRQARDRDLWFHVRGQSGCHVWIPRGQKGFGAKDAPPEHLVQAGCQLALVNSDAARSGFAVVDFTERRSLKKIAGQAGGVTIQRSETRSTHLDEAFEKRILKK